MFRRFIIPILSIARPIRVPILLAVQLLCLFTPSGWTQEGDTDEAAAQPQKGFQFTLHSSEMLEVLDDFDRYCDRGDWDRASRALNNCRRQIERSCCATSRVLCDPSQRGYSFR